MKIGFIGNIYGTPKGHSYVVRELLSACKEAGHETHMFRLGDNLISEEFCLPDTMKTYRGNKIPEDLFLDWVEEVRPDICIFNEYCQWWEEDHDKVAICKDMGIKTIGYLVWEKLDWTKKEHYKAYTHIISPTNFQTKLYRKQGIFNVVTVPWGVDLKEIDAIETPEKTDDKIRFYHCAGSGGVGDRKNTEAVIEAYKLIQDDTTDLMITHIGAKTFSRKEILAFTKYADVLVNTAKWDTMGLNTMEGNACGKPVLVCNASPMTEFIINNVNGCLVDGKIGTNPNVTCPTIDVDVVELSNKMNICKNSFILEMLKSNSRKYAERNFDWSKNKESFVKLLR